MPKSKSINYFDNQVNLRYTYLDWDNRHKSAMQNIGVKIDPNVNTSVGYKVSDTILSIQHIKLSFGKSYRT